MHIQEVTFSVEEQTLRGRLFYPKKIKKNPAVIFVHGWTSDYEGYIPRAEALVPLGYIVLIFDLRGHGKSDGKIEDVTANGSLSDCLAAYDFVASLPEVDKEKISVVGSSYGGYLSALIAGKRSLDSLVLRVPAIYRNDTMDMPKVEEIDEERKLYKQSVLSSMDNFALDAIHKFSSRLLLIESEKDEILPHQIAENYRNAIGNPKIYKDIVMKDADHSLTQEKWRKEYIDILVDWFSKLKELDPPSLKLRKDKQ